MVAVVVILFLFLITIIWMMVVTYRLWKCSGASAFGAIFVCSVLGAVSLLAFGCAIAFGTTNGGIAWGLKFAVVMSVATGFATLVTLSAGILISLFVEYRQTTELLARMKPLDWARGGGPSVRRVTHERTCAGRKAWPIGVACCIGASCVFLLYPWPIFTQNSFRVTLAIWLALLGITIIVLSLRCNMKIRKSSFILLSVILVITALVGGGIASRNALLLVAVENSSPAAVRVLLACGADVNATDEAGNTPLHRAARSGSLEVAKLLIEHGAEVNAIGNVDRRPLHYAAYSGSLEVVKLLIQHGADVNVKSTKGRTPLAIAMEEDHSEIAELLRQHGAKE